ncbi:MAG: transposase, partial [Clostridia bacterium]|nr:transposase [Clostridia bacterium]
KNETFRQGLFSKRILRQKGDVLIVAFDTSTVSTYSENQNDARYGFNNDKDRRKTIKLLALYASETNEPLG